MTDPTMIEGGAEACDISHVEDKVLPGLAGRAGDLSRAVVMKTVLGPHLDAMMRPIYEPELAPEEEAQLPSLENGFPRHVLEHFSDRTRHILKKRFDSSVRGTEEYREFIRLSENRPELLFYSIQPSRIFEEAIDTSVNAPLTVASQISGTEGDIDSIAMYRILHADVLKAIMERAGFDAILLHLTKGPNEFLGKGSDGLNVDRNNFFSFRQDDGPLRYRDAFSMRDGEVVGLSDEYFVAAQRRRLTLEAGRAASHKGTDFSGLPVHNEPSPNAHRGYDSSGCPVRHRFEDATGELQEPLIVTAKKFVISALERADRIPLKATI